MNIIIWLLLVVMGFYFWIVGRSEQDLNKIMTRILYLLFAFIILLISALTAFTVTNDTVALFDNTAETQGIHYLLFGFAFISFLEMVVSSIAIFKAFRSRQISARDSSR